MNVETATHIRHEAKINGISNCFFNGVIAYFLLKEAGELAWWGQHSFGFDIIATALILPLIVALIIIPLQRRKARQEKIPAISLDNNRWLERLLSKFPQSLFLTALLLGVITTLIISPITLLGFYLLSIDSVAALHYAIFKGIWAGVMAVLITGPMVLIGLDKTRL